MPIFTTTRLKSFFRSTTQTGCCAALILALCGAPHVVYAAKLKKSADREQISGLCDSAALRASAESGVPIDVLRAITRTETGRKSQSGIAPWPWTVNMEGAGKWFESEKEARAYVAAHFQRGARSFDVGCFQINYKWHHKAFETIDQMFDPLANARYAARFLNELHTEFGSWTRAAGAFHSRTPKYADRYVKRFSRIRQSLGPVTQVAALPQTRASRRKTTFNAPRPLVAGLRTSALISDPSRATAAQLGSLVPMSGGSGQALIAFK